ncbi:MAG: bifunctional aldolase/short-chain dehydrogenase [Gammaproteobacteria bacterium]|nr:MAG: bifunctional aldolase/short-chain dehydrogenase [Gammaproteobacteria bacterium]
MKNFWNDKEAAHYDGELGLRVYTSRLLGRDKTLVLHGGGNTSVKITETDLFGDDIEILYVKGSGWDLETIKEPGFSPVKLHHLIKLASLEKLSDINMVNELRANMTLAGAPTPSVEAILHAILPYQYVDHTHANAVVTITNTENGLQRIREIYGDSMVIIPYVMPGFDLARLCAIEYKKQVNANTRGMILMNHGIFSFADTAKESYEHMIRLVDMAEQYLAKHNALTLPAAKTAATDLRPQRLGIAIIRHEISAAAGFPVVMHCQQNNDSMDFIHRKDIASISQQGPATPDHVIRSKRLPMLGRDVKGYVSAYTDYFNEYNKTALTMLDPAPRILLDKEFGLCTLGRSAKDAAIVADIYRHTMDIIRRSTLLGGYQALPAKDIFEVEYWELEQAKLNKGSRRGVNAGEVVLITGAASGIGKACVESFFKRGAAVVALDINEDIIDLFARPDFLGIQCDVSDEQQIIQALEQGVRHYGGLDMLVLNAGIFPGGCAIADMALDEWNRVMQINLNANMIFMRECHPLLKLSPGKGRVVIIGSKNIAAPGPGAAAYSSSKAALNQLARVAALEWGEDGIRINSLHPDAVFDTGIWTDEVLASRAKHYGLSVQEYRTKNILKTEITSHDVAELAAEMCGPLFAKTTAAQLPVDGGNDRVI